MILGHPHTWHGTFIRAEYEQIAAAGSRRQDHAVGYTETHLAWFQIRHHYRVTANQVSRFIGGFDAGKYIADFATDVQCELYQLICLRDRFGVDDLCNLEPPERCGNRLYP